VRIVDLPNRIASAASSQTVLLQIFHARKVWTGVRQWQMRSADVHFEGKSGYRVEALNVHLTQSGVIPRFYGKKSYY
jgi:hypothetical protein